jgi:hypothetical protein
VTQQAGPIFILSFFSIRLITTSEQLEVKHWFPMEKTPTADFARFTVSFWLVGSIRRDSFATHFAAKIERTI